MKFRVLAHSDTSEYKEVVNSDSIDKLIKVTIGKMNGLTKCD